MKTRSLAFLLMVALLATLAVGVAADGHEGGKVLNYSFLSGDIPSLDPSLATDTSSIQIITEIFPGLTRLNEQTVELESGVASWEVSEDGLSYTFTIQEGISWVHYDAEAGEVVEVTDEDGNVRTLTANDFAYGMERTVNPETAGDYAYVLAGWVANGEAVNAGEADLADLGVEVVDDLTLVVTAPQQAAFVPNVLGLWMAAAQPSWLVEAEGDFWTEAENIQSYGPFVVSEWEHGDHLTLVKNPFWAGSDTIPASTLDAIVFNMLEESAQLANFEAGTLDVAPNFPPAEVDRLKAEYPDAYSVGPDTCTYYYGFNVEKEPFTDARVRRAFSMAIDRQAIIDNILKGGQVPANVFSRPDLVAAPNLDTHPDVGIFSDAEAAIEELQAYMDESGMEELPPITIMHNESEAHAQIAQAAQQMWSDTLGVDVEIATQEWAVYLTTVREDAPQIYRLGWCLDYPDAHNFLFDVFHSTSEFNGTNWVNEDYDALLEQAMVETDTDVRRDLYAQAEQLLVNEGAAIAPIYFYTTQALTQPWVDRTFSLVGAERFEKWDLDVEAQGA